MGCQLWSLFAGDKKYLQDKLNDLSEEIKKLRIGGSNFQIKEVDNPNVEDWLLKAKNLQKETL